MKKSLIFLANGFEEIEALATADVLRRGGMDVTLVSINPSLEVTGANGITVKADALMDSVDTADVYEWLICPGGMPGAENLVADARLCSMLKAHHAAGRNIAAICAAPAVVLASLGLLKDVDATCYPGFESLHPDVRFTGRGVEVADAVVTGRGPGYAVEFALAILAVARGQEVADNVAKGMLVR